MSRSKDRPGRDGPHDRSLPDREEADLARSLAYLDGALTADEARAFERRLGTEAALARAFEELAATDAELRRALAADDPRARARRWTPWLARGAVAAGIALAFATLWFARPARETRPDETFRLALVETAPADADFNALLGFDADWLPIGMGYRAAEADAAPQADEYASALERALRERAGAALDAEVQPLQAASFLLAFRPARECRVILVVAWDGGGRERVLPRGALDTPLAAGATYFLPGDPLCLPDDWRESQRVDYEPGILTRKGVDVTLAVRAEVLSPELLAELDGLVSARSPASDPTRLRAWFAERGFDVRELRVDPR